MMAMVGLLKDYVDPILVLYDSIYRDAAHRRAEEARAAEEEAQREAEKDAEEGPELLHQRSRLESVESSGENSSSESSEDDVGSSPAAPVAVAPMPAKKFVPSNLQRSRQSMGRRTSGMSTAIQVSVTTLPTGCQCVPLTYELIHSFLGPDPCVTLEKLLDGDESLEIKGIRYWTEQLAVLQQCTDKVKEDIRVSLEEKRNFFSFVLTVVTVFLAPLTILTGYWGMNFRLLHLALFLIPKLNLLFVVICTNSKWILTNLLQASRFCGSQPSWYTPHFLFCQFIFEYYILPHDLLARHLLPT